MFLAKGGNNSTLLSFLCEEAESFFFKLSKIYGLSISREKLYKKSLFHNIEREINYVILYHVIQVNEACNPQRVALVVKVWVGVICSLPKSSVRNFSVAIKSFVASLYKVLFRF